MKTWAKRSLRTFLQTAVGYIAVNIAAGLAAVMNLKEV